VLYAVCRGSLAAETKAASFVPHNQSPCRESASRVFSFPLQLSFAAAAAAAAADGDGSGSEGTIDGKVEERGDGQRRSAGQHTNSALAPRSIAPGAFPPGYQMKACDA